MGEAAHLVHVIGPAFESNNLEGHQCCKEDVVPVVQAEIRIAPIDARVVCWAGILLFGYAENLQLVIVIK